MYSLRTNTNFLKLFSGRIVTNAGDSLYTIAAFWLIQDLTGSSFYTGIAGVLLLAPPILQFLTGPFIDRWSLRRVLVGTQSVQAVILLLVPVTDWTGYLSVWVVLFVIPLLAIINQFVYPAQRTLLPRIVDEDDLVDANSAFSVAKDGMNLLFNAVGGILITVLGAVPLFMVNSGTFIVSALLFAAIQVPVRENSDEQSDMSPEVQTAFTEYTTELKAGVSYLRGTLLVPIMLVAAVVNFVVGAMMAVLPKFATIHGGPEIYGALLAAMGGGMLLGSLVASAIEYLQFGYTMIAGFMISFGAWLGIVYSPWASLTVVLYVVAWVPAGIYNVMEEAMIQSNVDENKLGRVNSVATSLAMFTLPIGSFVAGVVSSYVGVRSIVLVSGTSFFVVAIYVLVHPQLRRLPAVADIDGSRLRLA